MVLDKLQKDIKDAGLDGLYVTLNNMFIGQDILDEENNILKLTGFSGSAAELIVTSEKVYLFTDGRYELQAKQEVNADKVEVFTAHGDMFDFLKNHKEKDDVKIGFNPWTISINKFEKLQHIIKQRRYGSLSFVHSELIDIRKNIKKPNIFEHNIKFAGQSREDKVKKISETMKRLQLDAHFASSADSVSWLLNLRSDYLKNSPIFRAYALIDQDNNLTIFSDDADSFEGLKILSMQKIEDVLVKFKGKKLNFDKNTPVAILHISQKNNIDTFHFLDFCETSKAQKNDVEIAGTKNAHIKDGVAVTKFLYWLEKNKKEKTELDIVEQLFMYRKQQDLFFSNSFDTIAGFGSNGAIVHYHPTEKTNKTINEGSFLLLDSGGQYFDGTTDVTRTIAIDEVSQEMKDDYTLVLKSHIALASASFPDKIPGELIDAIAREALWKYGKDYSHGTGHGVGFFLNVHEGPQRISPRDSLYPLSENMIVSIEPGYYKENCYGIRIENLYLIKKNVNNNMLEFEELTMIPIETKNLNKNMMTTEEISWVVSYNEKVFENISPLLDKEERIWLKNYIL